MKIGRKWRFSRRQLLEWIEDGGEWIPEALVDLGLVALAEERMATATDEDLVDWEEAKAELGLADGE